MSHIISIRFDAAGPVIEGADGLPSTATGAVAPTPLTAPVAGRASADSLDHGWMPDGALTVDGVDGVLTFGECAMDVVLAGVTATRPGALVSGSGIPAAVSLSPDDSGGTRVTAVVRTTGAPASLDTVLPVGTDVARIGVWIAGTEAALAVDGVIVARRRTTAPAPPAAGTIVLGGAPADDGTPTAIEATIVEVTVGDLLDATQEAELARAASDGLGEIDSLVASGIEGSPGAPTAAPMRQGGVRWQTFGAATAYWSAATGAHLVYERIGAVHSARGGVLGRLGLPISGESGVAELLERLRVKPRGKSGLTGWDVLQSRGVLSRQDTVLPASDAALRRASATVRASALVPTASAPAEAGERHAGAAIGERLTGRRASRPLETALGSVSVHRGVGAALERGEIGAVEASVALPQAFLRNDALSAAITALRPDTRADARPVGEDAGALGGLLADSERRGVPIQVAVGDLGYVIIGPRAQLFQHGIVIVTANAAVELYDEILAHWLLLGGTRGFLGAPRGSQIGIVGGAYADFGGGRIYWSAPTGAHEVHGAILDRYFNTDGTDRAFGFPTSDELAVDGFETARMSTFERGIVFWRPETGAVKLAGDFLAAWNAADGIAHYGLPTTEMQKVTRGGVEYRWQVFDRGVLMWTADIGIFDQLAVRIARVATGNIDDGFELSGLIPREDTTAELIVKAWVWVDGAEVLHKESGHGGASMDFSDWETAPFPVRPETTVRIRIEAWDWDEISSNDRLAERDVTYTMGGDLWGLTEASGAHLNEPSTANDSSNADGGDVTFDYSVSPPVAIEIGRMREHHFWRFSNKGRDHLPWSMYKETFVDIDGDDVNYFTDPLDSWYYDSQYEDVADGGNCFGFSVSAIDAFQRRGGVPQPLSQQTSDRVDDKNWRLINRGQGSQKAASVVLYKIGAKLEPDFCDPRRVWGRVKARTDAGTPITLSLRGYDDAKDAGVGHAVIAHRCEQAGDGARRIYIADSNVPYGPGWERDESSMIVIGADGSFHVEPSGTYPEFVAPAFEEGSLGKRYLMEIPESAYASPLRTPVWDSATALACLAGGILTSDGAAVGQVEAGGRKLVGDQRRRLIDDLRLQSEVLDGAVRGGIVEAAQPIDEMQLAPDEAASVVATGLRDQQRLVSAAALVADNGSVGLDLPTAAIGFASALDTVPGAERAKASWGSVSLISSERADRIEAALNRSGVSIGDLITPGAMPDVAFVHADDDRPGREIVAFRGTVPDEITVTLRGRGEVYRTALLGRAALIRTSAPLARGALDTLVAQQLAGLRPGVRIIGAGEARIADVSLDLRKDAGQSAGGDGPSSWAVRLGVGGGCIRIGTLAGRSSGAAAPACRRRPGIRARVPRGDRRVPRRCRAGGRDHPDRPGGPRLAPRRGTDRAAQRRGRPPVVGCGRCHGSVRPIGGEVDRR